MATSKTLTPTNETITIDAFQGEKPDYRHVADAEGKLADAINALNSQIATTYGSIDGQEITWERTGNVVIIYFNGKTVTTSSGWTSLATLPSGMPTSRYSVHVKTVTDQDVRLSGDSLYYRGTGGGVFGELVYIAH